MKATRRILAFTLAAASLVGALPSDALIDSLSVAAAMQEKAGNLSERDQTESLLEMLARQRVVADSAPEQPKKTLDRLDHLRSERSRRESDEQASLRKPPTEVAKLLESDTVTEPAPEPAEPVAAKVDTPKAAKTTKFATICPSGPVRIEWIQSNQRPVQERQDSVFPLKVRIDAPCGLSRIDLFMDEAMLRSFPVPLGKVGSFEFSDAIVLTPGIHRLDIVACDSSGICSRSIPLESKLTKPVSPWIPRAVGGLVGLCVLLGLILILRRLSHHAPVSRSAIHSVPLPESTGVSATIRHRLQLVAKEIGPSFPAVSLRIPDAPPQLSIDPESLGESFGNILRLHARRTAEGGQILIAMGHGPLSAEIVFEDTAASPEEATIPLLLDPTKARLKERMELDRELETARQLIVKSNGSISMEARIDGGLRTRVRLRLAPQKDKV